MATLPSTDPAAGTGTGTEPCRVARLGTLDYREAWRLQVETADRVRRGVGSATLLLLEHPHTYTRGRLAPDSDFLLDHGAIERSGAEIVETDRGGLITYHGPGQLVAYPIIRLKGRGGPHWYVRTLERVISGSLSEIGLSTSEVPGLTGVWTTDGRRKLAAIGVKIAGGVAYHGFAINVYPDLSMFDAIIPCGIADRGVSSVVAELAEGERGPSVGELAEVVAGRFCAEFGFRRL